MKEKPILFNTEMVKAILEGRKTQTRRVIIPQPRDDETISIPVLGRGYFIDSPSGRKRILKNISRIGDRLWVKETFVISNCDNPVFKADFRDSRGDFWASIADDPEGIKWKSALFMPKKYARIWREVTGVRAERLQDISQADVIAEGIDRFTFARGCLAENPPDPRWAFIELWDSTNSKNSLYQWKYNPYVWVVELEKGESLAGSASTRLGQRRYWALPPNP